MQMICKNDQGANQLNEYQSENYLSFAIPCFL